MEGICDTAEDLIGIPEEIAIGTMERLYKFCEKLIEEGFEEKNTSVDVIVEDLLTECQSFNGFWDQYRPEDLDEVSVSFLNVAEYPFCPFY